MLGENNLKLAESNKLENLYRTLSCSSNIIAHPMQKNSKVTGSRHKAKMVVEGTVDRPIIGVRNEQGIVHQVSSCALHHTLINTMIEELRVGITNFNLTPYNLSSKKGEVKYIILFVSPDSSELMIRTVVRSRECVDRLKKLYQMLQQKYPSFKVGTANIQPNHSAIIEGEIELVLTEHKTMRADLGDVALFIGPNSFFQVNPEIALSLYRTAEQAITQLAPKSVLDLFCGVGAFSQFLVKKGIACTGVELSSEAIACARMANELNGGSGDYLASDATLFMQAQKNNFDIVLVNPPRRGLNQQIIDKIKEVNPNQVVYSSCNPQSLARDLKAFLPNYHLTEFTPFDMFPMTDHFEVLAILSKN